MDYCVICKNTGTLNLGIKMDYFTLYHCKDCKSLTAHPRPTSHFQIDYHNTETYHSHPYFKNRRIKMTYEKRCRTLFEKVYKLFPHFINDKGLHHLDIGCDTGQFLLSAQKIYKTIPYGIDVSNRAINEAKNYNISTFCGELKDAPSNFNQFPIVTVIDLIEHVNEPLELLTQINRRMCSGGMCYIETPNLKSIIFELTKFINSTTHGQFKTLCERVFPQEHIQYFSQKGLERLCIEAGFKIKIQYNRVLSMDDIGSSLLIKLGMGMLQCVDKLRNEAILSCVILEKI